MADRASAARMMYGLARKALFALDAERSHELTIALLSRFPRAAALPFSHALPEDSYRWKGLQFRNRVGLAAGLDKHGQCIDAFDRMGFGFIEVGTVTPRPQPGNPRPRVFRLPRHQALINRLGFNSHGVDALVDRLRGAGPRKAVLGINIGKNFDTPVESAAHDYELCLRRVCPYADYVTVNISSPNTPHLRDLQGSERLKQLLARLVRVREELAQQQGRAVPLLVKIAPDLDAEQLGAVAMIAREHGVDGIIATNTTLQRPGLSGVALADEAGGLSGAPLRPLALGALKELRGKVGKDFLLIGVGGIMDGDAARERREAGANLVQIYTGLIYRGPELLRECVKAMLPVAAGVR